MDTQQSAQSGEGQEFKPYIKKKNVEGVEFDFFIGDPAGMSWYDVDCTDPDWPEMRFMRDRLVREGDVVFECGGHHGCTAVVLSRWVGATGKVVSFEPHPRNAEILQRNLDLNRIGNATLRRYAVGAAPGTVLMRDASNASVTSNVNAPRAFNAEVVKLDDFRDEKPTVLKIDVEGFETEVLKGATEILKTRPKLAIEVHTPGLGNYGTSVAQMLGYLDIAAYQLWVQWDDDSDPVPYDIGTPITTRVHLFAIPIGPAS